MGLSSELDSSNNLNRLRDLKPKNQNHKIQAWLYLLLDGSHTHVITVRLKKNKKKKKTLPAQKSIELGHTEGCAFDKTINERVEKWFWYADDSENVECITEVKDLRTKTQTNA